MHVYFRVRVMVFNATFNNISAINFIGGVPWEIYRAVGVHWQTLSHNVSSTLRHEWDSLITKHRRHNRGGYSYSSTLKL